MFALLKLAVRHAGGCVGVVALAACYLPARPVLSHEPARSLLEK